jgi:hypothetical protein
MEVFIDKNFVRNYWNADCNKNINDDFVFNFLRLLNNCKIITNYSSLDEIVENDEDYFLFDELFEGIPKMEFKPKLSSLELYKEYSKSGGYKLFFIEFDLEIQESLERELGYRFISSRSLGAKWGLFLKFKDIKQSTSNNGANVFKSWDDLSFINRFPTNTILIVDKYILQDGSNNTIKDNIIPLLEKIIPVDHEGELNITILTEKILEGERSKINDVSKRAVKVHRKLNSHFADYKNINFSIVNNHKTFYPKQLDNIHDRYIYTNYYTIECQQGFNLFKGKKRKNVNSRVDIYFNFQHFHMENLKAHLETLKEYLDKMNRIEVWKEFKHYPNKLYCPLLS